MRIIDNDGPAGGTTPSASFASASQSVDEDSGASDVTVNLSPAPAADIALSYTVDGTATSGSDYAALSGTVAVSKGATTATIPVAVIDDSENEGAETVVLTLAAGEGYKVGSTGTHTLTIAASDPPVATFASASQSADEGSGTSNVTVNLSPAPAADITLTYTVDGTATSGSDYTALSGTLSVPKDATTTTIPVTLIDDGANEGAETVVLTLAAGSGYEVGSPDTHTLTIAASDPPTVSFASASQSAQEDSGTSNVTVNLSPAPAADITLAYTVDGTATSGSDYTALSGTVTVPKDATTATLPVTLIDDSAEEGSETVVLTLAAGSDYAVGSPDTHTLTIAASDPPAASFASASQTAQEGSGTSNVTVNLSPAPAADITLAYTVGGTATSGSDYTALSGTLSVPKDATTATIPVAIVDDSANEDAETVVLTLSAGSGYEVGSPGTHTLTIAASDPPTVSFASASQTVQEGSGTSNVTVNLSPAPATDITLSYTVDGTATSGSDYTALSGTLSVPKDATTATIPVAIIDDGANEGAETVVLTLAAGSGYEVGSPGAHTLTIAASDGPPQVSFEPIEGRPAGNTPTWWVKEGSGTHDVKVKLNPPPTSDITVKYKVSGKAVSGSDYTALSGTLSVPKGATTATIPVAIIDDDEREFAEEIVLFLLGGTGYEVGRPDRHTLVIDPSDGLPWVSLVPVQQSAGEGSGTHDVGVRLGPAPATDIAFAYRVAGTATSGSDYKALSGSVTVSRGTTTATIPVTLIDDSLKEGSETIILDLTGSGGYKVTSPGTHTLTIVDDETPASLEPQVTIAAGASPVTEGSDATFTVTANPAPASPLAVSVTVATDGEYGVTAGSRTVTIPTTGSETLTLATTGDDADEPDGSVTATVTDGEGYTVGASASASVAIADDDPTPTPGVDAALVAEVAAKADGHSNPDAAARLRRVVKGMTGEDGGYTAQECRETATHHGVLSTWKPWCDEIARREAHAPPEPQQQVVTVPAVSVSAGADVTEGGDAVFTVTADPAPAADLAVSVDIAADGAYGITAGKRTVTIPTTGSETLTLATTNDEVDEPDGSVTATVAAGEGYTVGDPASGSVSIQDDDEPPPAEPAVTIAAGASPVTEGADATFTLTASPAPASPLTVSVTVAADGAYGITAGKQTVTIPTAGSATLTLATTNDDTDEPDGSVTVTLNDGDGYTVGAPASDTLSIEDDDLPPPVVTVTASPAPVTEGADAVFTVSASRAPDADLAVTLEVADAPDSDFVAGGDEGARTVTIPDGATSVVFTLATANDEADEPDGVVTVTVKDGDGYTVGTPASDTLSIEDDDLPPPAVSVAAKAGSVTEGGSAVFTLTADRAPDADLTVTLSVAETGGGDHVAAADEGPATAVIAKGATEAAFSVATVDDDVDEPDGAVTVTLKDGGGYTVPSPPGNAATVAVSDNDAAAGPVLSVDDATGQENGRLPAMPFTVRLSAPVQDAVRVYVSTRPSTPMSATPKVDYAPASYALLFRAGETEKQVWVMIHNDSHDEEPETFEVVLSKAQGAPIGDGVAVGTIVNDDPMPAAWLARFGRTVAEQALDGIAGRLAAPRTAGMQGAIAGQTLTFGAPAPAGPDHAPAGSPNLGGTGSRALSEAVRGFAGHDAAGLGNGPGALSPGGAGATQSHVLTAREALLGSSFTLTGAADATGGSMALWGRGSQGRFDGREGTFSLDGEVTTGMLGADYARGKWLVGLALAQSAGEGEYRDTKAAPRPGTQTCPAVDGEEMREWCDGAVRAGDGTVEASLTAAIPYASLHASERLTLWGAVGTGSGEVTLDTALGGSYKSDTTWRMAAAGLRGALLTPPTEGSGPALALTSDALWTRTASEKTHDLAASESDATRLRLGVEGSWRRALDGGGHLAPKLEVGARHDGGDAETGFGIELGGGIAWSDPALGLSLDVSGRTLLSHEDDDLKDRGYAAALGFDPSPGSERGPSFSLRQELGTRAGGGLDALFAPAPLEDRTDSEAASRWSLEGAYGVPAFGGRWTASPHVGLGLSASARDYSLGWRWTPARSAPDLAFGVKATRRESDTAAPEHTVGVEVRTIW